MQVGDSVSVAFCKFLRDSSDSSLLKPGHPCPQRFLKRLQLIGLLNGSLPKLPPQLLREVLQYWDSCFEQPLDSSTDELRLATNRWLQRQDDAEGRIDKFFNRLRHMPSDAHRGRSNVLNGHPPTPLLDTTPALSDALHAGAMREWIRQLTTRPRWTHLASMVPGTAPAKLTEAFRVPCLRRRELGQRAPGIGDIPTGDDLQPLLLCFEPICWISGEPGSGKSTLLQWLVHQLIHQASWPGLMPIAIDLRAYSNHCERVGYQSLTRFFFQSLDLPHDIRLQLGRTSLDRLPPQPRCAFLLDEWTECDGYLRERVWQEIQVLASHHKTIITSRSGEAPLPTQHAYQVAEFTLDCWASEQEAQWLKAGGLQPTAWHLRALNQIDHASWQPTTFIGHVIHSHWQRFNVLAHRAEQLKAAHLHVLESLALTLMEQPDAEPEFDLIDLERLCEQHRIESTPLLRSRLLSRSAREPTRLRFAQAGYLPFFAAKAITQSSLSDDHPRLSRADECLSRWTLSQVGTTAFAHVASISNYWKRRAIQLVQQASDQGDLFGHRLLRLTDVVLVCTSHRSSRRSRFISRLVEAFQRPCPVEVQQAFVRATVSLQQTPVSARSQQHIDPQACRDNDLPSIDSLLHRLAITSFADPAIDSLLSSLTGRTWPFGQELLVEFLADTSLPSSRRQCAWEAIRRQPPMSVAPSLLNWIESLWDLATSSGQHSANSHGKCLGQMLSHSEWMTALRVLADAGQKLDRPWLRWLAYKFPLMPVRLLAIELLEHAFHEADSGQGRAERDQQLKTLIKAMDAADVDESKVKQEDWKRFFDRFPDSLKARLQDSSLRPSLLHKLDDFIHRPQLSRLSSVHKVAHLLALTYLPTERAIGKRLIQSCMTLRTDANQPHSAQSRQEIIAVWLAAIADDDPEVLYEFDFDNETFRLALEQVVWQRGWLFFDDRIVGRNGTTVGTRLLETEDWVDDEIPTVIQRIAQQLPERQRADFLSYCQMISAGDTNYLHSTPETIYQDMVKLLGSEGSSRVVDRLQYLYPDAQPPSFDSWRKNLQRVQRRYRNDPEISAHLRQLGLGVNKRKAR